MFCIKSYCRADFFPENKYSEEKKFFYQVFASYPVTLMPFSLHEKHPGLLPCPESQTVALVPGLNYHNTCTFAVLVPNASCWLRTMSGHVHFHNRSTIELLLISSSWAWSWTQTRGETEIFNNRAGVSLWMLQTPNYGHSTLLPNFLHWNILPIYRCVAITLLWVSWFQGVYSISGRLQYS